MTRFNLFDESELEYIDELLFEDIRNNSAWNQRMFYFNNRPTILLDADAENEIKYITKFYLYNINDYNYFFLYIKIIKIGIGIIDNF